MKDKRVDFNPTNSNYKIIWRVEHYLRLNVDHFCMAGGCFVPALTTNRNDANRKKEESSDIYVISSARYPTWMCDGWLDGQASANGNKGDVSAELENSGD